MDKGAGGLGLLGTLTLIFIVLKLVGTITWSWWWVLSPLWLPPVAVLLILIFAVVIAAIASVVMKLLEEK